MRVPLPLNGRDIVTGAGLWIGLYLIVSNLWSQPVQTAAGLVLIIVVLALVMPRVRPWPLVQLRLHRQRHRLTLPISLGNRVSMAVPGAIRSGIGLLCGQWLAAAIAARLVDTSPTGGQLTSVAPVSTAIVVMIVALIDL